MTVEDRLREAIHVRTSEVEPSPPSASLARIEERLAAARRARGRRRLLAGLSVAAAVLVVTALAAGLLGGDDGDDDVRIADDRTTTTTSPPTTTTSTTETSPPTTTTTGSTPATTAGEGTTTTPAEDPAPAEVDPAVPVWPRTHEDLRFDDPVAAARSFATDFVGFSDPDVGSFQAGDGRSGEVAVRPAAGTGPTTTVFVRLLEDDTWWVVGSAGADVTLDQPATGAAAPCPLRVTGSALAFEGTVEVEVRDDHSTQPIGSGFVTGGGDVARPFDGTVACSYAGLDGRLPYVTVLLTTTSAEDGSVLQATARRLVAATG